MANLSVSKSWGTEILYPADLNQNFTDVLSYINTRNGGGTAWDALNVTGTSTLTGAVSCGSTLTVTGNIITAGGPSTITGYRRPVLTFISVTQVDIENNTGTSNQTSIMFPDGVILSVTEDTSSTNKYRRFDITATANFSSGTEDSGLRSGLAEATNTWYAIYAVKSAINTANFVLAGDTTLPTQANFSTLNGRYGTNGWVYLGMIRNGDNRAATGDILNFKQSGRVVFFTNTYTGSKSAKSEYGMELASAASGSTATYTYSSGTGATDIPAHLSLVIFGVNINAGTAVYSLADSGNTIGIDTNSFAWTSSWLVASKGLAVSNNSSDRNIGLRAFCDSLLVGDVTHTI